MKMSEKELELNAFWKFFWESMESKYGEGFPTIALINFFSIFLSISQESNNWIIFNQITELVATQDQKNFYIELKTFFLHQITKYSEEKL